MNKSATDLAARKTALWEELKTKLIEADFIVRDVPHRTASVIESCATKLDADEISCKWTLPIQVQIADAYASQNNFAVILGNYGDKTRYTRLSNLSRIVTAVRKREQAAIVQRQRARAIHAERKASMLRRHNTFSAINVHPAIKVGSPDTVENYDIGFDRCFFTNRRFTPSQIEKLSALLLEIAPPGHNFRIGTHVRINTHVVKTGYIVNLNENSAEVAIEGTDYNDNVSSLPHRMVYTVTVELRNMEVIPDKACAR